MNVLIVIHCSYTLLETNIVSLDNYKMWVWIEIIQLWPAIYIQPTEDIKTFQKSCSNIVLRHMITMPYKRLVYRQSWQLKGDRKIYTNTRTIVKRHNAACHPDLIENISRLYDNISSHCIYSKLYFESQDLPHLNLFTKFISPK